MLRVYFGTPFTGFVAPQGCSQGFGSISAHPSQGPWPHKGVPPTASSVFGQTLDRIRGPTRAFH
eukprot:9284026-Pyramimonas_sp.AAC.1